jgi:hypothetical protein
MRGLAQTMIRTQIKEKLSRPIAAVFPMILVVAMGNAAQANDALFNANAWYANVVSKRGQLSFDSKATSVRFRPSTQCAYPDDGRLAQRNTRDLLNWFSEFEQAIRRSGYSSDSFSDRRLVLSITFEKDGTGGIVRVRDTSGADPVDAAAVSLLSKASSSFEAAPHALLRRQGIEILMNYPTLKIRLASALPDDINSPWIRKSP